MPVSGVGGEFDAVDGEHVAPDQALCIAGYQDLVEQRFDLIAEVGDELGNVGVTGLAVAADGDELDVALACQFDRATRDEALAVGQQDDLEHDARVIGAGPHFVILEPGIQGLEVEFMIDQVVQCEGERAGDDLFGQNHG